MLMEVGKLKPNPFKKWINGGKLNENILEKLDESAEHGTLPEIFTARKNEKDELEISYGHHRLETIKRKKGAQHKVNVILVNYNDEQMLIDMIRENLTHRDTDYRDMSDSIILARNWLMSKATHVKQFDTVLRDKKGRFQPVNGSYRDVANFLSKEGKTVSHETVRQYLDIEENLLPEIKKDVEKVTGRGDKEAGVVPVWVAAELSRFPKNEQKAMKEAIMESEIQSRNEVKSMLTKFRDLPEKEQDKVLDGKASLYDVAKSTDIEEDAKTIAKSLAESLPKLAEHMKNYAATKKDITNRDFLENIISMANKGLVFCPKHGKSSLSWTCCNEEIEKTVENLKKKEKE